MSGNVQTGGTGPSHRAVEVGVAILVALFGGIVIAGSLRVGIGWGAEGPKSGFFPFYLGVLIVLASAVNLAHALQLDGRKLFAEWAQLGQVLSVLIPTAIYVLAIPYTGIYLASAVLIAVFMRWLGRYRWPLTAAVAIGTPIILFLVFEFWFLVPLPKGPVEDWLGL
jgi:putative tricarboxylic transport membrane protein